jgi:hypothetical protein
MANIQIGDTVQLVCVTGSNTVIGKVVYFDSADNSWLVIVPNAVRNPIRSFTITSFTITSAFIPLQLQPGYIGQEALWVWDNGATWNITVIAKQLTAAQVNSMTNLIAHAIKIGDKVRCKCPMSNLEFTGTVAGQDPYDKGYLIAIDGDPDANDDNPFFVPYSNIINGCSVPPNIIVKTAAWAWPDVHDEECVIVQILNNKPSVATPSLLGGFTDQMFQERLVAAKQYSVGCEGETNGPSGLKFL